MIGGGIGAFRARSVHAGRAGEWRESRPDRQRIRRSIAYPWGSKGFVILRPTLMDERLLRGGPAVYVPGGGYINANYGTNTARRVNGQLQANYSWNTERGFGNQFNATVRYRPASFVSVSAGRSG